MNPSRRGYVCQLVTHVSRLGVKAITGKPHKPTTQVDTFDRIYNTERPHQGCPAA